MKQFRDSVLSGGPLELGDVLRREAAELPELLSLLELSVAGLPLLEVVQRTLDALRLDPPLLAACAGPCRPWWTPMPSVYVAALFCHVGLGSLRCSAATARGTMPPHARESAALARAAMWKLQLPFEVREHALALILSYRQPENLVGSDAPLEAYMRLACRLDLRALYRLRSAELAALPEGMAARLRPRLEAFRARAQEAGVFGLAPSVPISSDQFATLGYLTARAVHRAANALRYFRLRTGLVDGEWLADRLAQESRRPQGRLNLLVGPAGCGKSTWAEQHLAHAPIVSSDRMREELTGDPADQSQNYLVFQRCIGRLRDALRNGEVVTFDATNYMEGLRALPVQAARWSGAEIHSFYFDVGLETVLERNRRRVRRVPEHVIRRQFRLLTPPALYEADQHWRVDEAGSVRLYWPLDPPQAHAQ